MFAEVPPTPSAPPSSAHLPGWCQTLLAAILDKKATNVLVIGIEEISSLGDFLILADTQSVQQTRAVVNEVEYRLEQQHQMTPRGMDRDLTGRWTVLDYGDAIVHVMTAQEREYYKLDAFWKNGKILFSDTPNATLS